MRYTKRPFWRQTRSLLLSVSIGLLAAVIFSSITVVAGDVLLQQDRLDSANTLYLLNSHNPLVFFNVSSRLLATQILLHDRQSVSEESGYATRSVETHRANVLGARVTIPVLMYHYIRVNPNPSDQTGFNLSVTPKDFSSQMDYLISQGYHTISLDELGAILFSNAQIPSKPIIITFDDGYSDSYFNAFPILRVRGLKAVSFVITGVVGVPSYLSWDQISDMYHTGIFTFESHTVTHRALISLNTPSVVKELADSKTALESHLGYPVNWFAYPYGAGAFDSRVSSLVQKTGYLGAFGTNPGSTQSIDYRFRLPRIRVNGGETLVSFAASLPHR